jgi:hypothetical protein
VSPAHEEAAIGYEVSAWVIPEAKTGDQVPKNFARFVGTDWFRRALRQSERAVAVGSGARPSVYVELPGRSGGYLIIPVDVRTL